MNNLPYGRGGFVPIDWMNTVTTVLILIIAPLGTLVSGLLLLWHQARRAPLGYEDGEGFHFGRSP